MLGCFDWRSEENGSQNVKRFFFLEREREGAERESQVGK